jgi:hypothetical protein
VSNEVVGLGAWCDFVPPKLSLASPAGVSFVVHEFAVLPGGRRITVHTERGFGVSGPRRPTARDPLAGLTGEQIEAEVRTTVLPGEESATDGHPYGWLRELLLERGVSVTAETLRSVPYMVEFSDRLQGLLDEQLDVHEG